MRVRNWELWQHYRDRNPPWIKFHYEALSSKWWISLDNNHRALALVCLLIASRHGGHVPDDIDYVRQVGHIKSKSTFKPLLQCRFLIQESGTETETETETEAQNDASIMKASATDAEFNAFWAAYPRKVGKAAARKAYAKARKSADWPGLDSALAAIERAKRTEQWRKDGGQYTPLPTTWLNQGRWDDEDVGRGVDVSGRPHVGRKRVACSRCGVDCAEGYTLRQGAPVCDRCEEEG